MDTLTITATQTIVTKSTLEVTPELVLQARRWGYIGSDLNECVARYLKDDLDRVTVTGCIDTAILDGQYETAKDSLVIDDIAVRRTYAHSFLPGDTVYVLESPDGPAQVFDTAAEPLALAMSRTPATSDAFRTTVRRFVVPTGCRTKDDLVEALAATPLVLDDLVYIARTSL